MNESYAQCDPGVIFANVCGRAQALCHHESPVPRLTLDVKREVVDHVRVGTIPGPSGDQPKDLS